MYVFSFLTLFILLMASSCVKGPGSEQVEVEPGAVGVLNFTEGTELGIMPVGQVQGFTLTLYNFGRLEIELGTLILDNETPIVTFVGGTFPGTGGTCATILSAKKSCTVKIQVFGNSSGFFSHTFSMAYKDGIKSTVYTGAFSGYLGREANIEVVGLDTHDYGIVEPFSIDSHLITVKNTGDLDAVNLTGFFSPEIPADNVFLFTGGVFPGTGGSCGSTLAGGAQCTLSLATSPIEAGRVNRADFKLAYKNPVSIKTMSYDLQVTSAELKAYLTVLETENFLGDVLNNALPGNETFVTWTIINNGLAPAKNIQLTTIGDIPLTLESTTCPVGGLAPKATCQVVYKFYPNYNLPQAFPIKFTNRALTMSYDDGKYAAPAVTNEFYLTAEVKDEAHLNFYRNGDNNLQFFSDPLSATAAATWARSEWVGIIGATNPENNLKIMNGSFGSRFPAKSVTYQIISSNSMLQIACINSSSCPVKYEAGSSFTMPIKFQPVYTDPFVPNNDYILRVTYDSGRRLKTYDLTIQTKAEANPLVSYTESGSLPEILAGKSSSVTITVKNDGPTGYTPAFTFTNLATISHFDIPAGTNTCASAVLKNGDTCTVEVTFTKASWNGNIDETSQVLRFDNGLAAADPNYEEFNIALLGKVLGPGFLTYAGGTIDFGKVAWSQTGISDKIFSKVILLDKEGGWEVSQFSMELTGPDAAHFTVTPQDPDEPAIKDGKFNTNFSPNVQLTSPQVGSGSSPLSATLVIRYYGNWESDFGSFDPADKIEIPITATPNNEPHIIVKTLPTGLGPLAQGLTDTSNITITNTGQTAPLSFATLNITGNPFIISSALSGSGCTVITTPNSRTVNFQLNPNADCIFEVKFTSPGSGIHQSVASLTYNDSDTAGISSSEVFEGRGLALAALSNLPGNSGGRDYNGYGDLKYGNNFSRTFTISNAASESADAQIIAATLVAMGGASCANSATIPPEWTGVTQVNGANNGFSITANNCNGQSLANGLSTCSVSVNFSPLHINKLIGACLQIEYRQYPGAPTTTFLRQRLLGRGLAPDAIFQGWHRLLAEGDTDTATSKVKLQWRPMAVLNDVGTISGYNVYRKLQGTGIYPNIPLNASPIITPVIGGVFEYTDNQSEPNEFYPDPLAPNTVYQYVVKPIVTLPGVPGTNETSTTELDKEVRMIVPASFAVLIHRWTANIIGCVEMLGKAYTDLNRSGNYVCNYNGPGSSGGLYDYKKDLILDRYENGRLSDAPTNNPVTTPHLYSDLASARASCEAQTESIEQLTISNKKKRLLSRRDYMLASYQQSSTDCVTDSNALLSTGRNACKSFFGAEDMIGNAWDMVDSELGMVSGTTWKYTSGDTINTNWRFPFAILDFDLINFTDYTTFMGGRAYSEANSPCINELSGFPMNSSAGICPAGTKSFASFGPSMNLSSEKNYILSLENTQDAFAEWEGKRMLFAGGSHNSIVKFNIDTHRFSIYWADGYLDSIMQTYLPAGAWEGGAARCALEVPY